MTLLRGLILLASLVHCGLCDTGSATTSISLSTSSSFSTITTTTLPTITSQSATPSAEPSLRYLSALSQAQPIQSSGPLGVTLSPLSNNATAPWGIEVESTVGGDEDTVIQLAFWESYESPTTPFLNYSVENSWLDLNAETSEQLHVATAEGFFNLNVENTLFITDNSSDLAVVLPTIPYGLNLGHKGYYNGSLVLGGSTGEASYDANRVANDSWSYLPESDNGHDDFVKHGGIEIREISIQAYDNSTSQGSNGPFSGASPKGAPKIYEAGLKFWETGIYLPARLELCNKTNFTITLNMRSVNANHSTYDSKLVIPIPTSMTQSTERCIENDEEDYVTLGQTFFQAAYLMIPDTSGRVFLAAANDQDLPVAPHPFPTAEEMVVVYPTAPAPKHANDSKPAKTAEIVGITFAILFVLGLVGILAFLYRRHRRRVASKTKLDQDSIASSFVNGFFQGS